MKFLKRFLPDKSQDDFINEIRKDSFTGSDLEFPARLQIQTVNTCNSSCVMCPASEKIATRTEFISSPLFEKIINESVEENGLKVITLMLQNEPFLDNRIFSYAMRIKEAANRRIKVFVVTNGSLLNKFKKELSEKETFDKIVISLDAFSKETYAKIRGSEREFDRIVQDIDNLIKSGLGRKLIVRMVAQKKNIGEIEPFYNYWSKKNIGVEVTELSNRCDAFKGYDELRVDFQNSQNQICFDVFYKMCILYNGDAIICCQDWQHKQILGNVMRNSLKDVWQGSKMKHYRELHRRGLAKELELCRHCSLIQNC